MGTLARILKENWEWRGRIWNLAIFELKKQSRGAAFGYAWFFVKPIVYVFCFWFALAVGLKAGKSVSGDAPYILWLTAGIFPWFFMRDMLHSGVDVLRKYSYLVKKVKFPMGAIFTIYALSSMLIELMLWVVLMALYFACGQGFDLYLLQVSLLIVVMFVFWWFFSMLMSPLCAMSRDVRQLMNALSTPFFWLSGVLFDPSAVGNGLVQTALLFNPITFITKGFRDALYTKTWLWEDPTSCICFIGVFLLTAVLAIVVFKKTYKEVADVL